MVLVSVKSAGRMMIVLDGCLAETVEGFADAPPAIILVFEFFNVGKTVKSKCSYLGLGGTQES